MLNGLTGVVTVAGSSYDGVMPARPDLGDQQLASILNYVASAWGNSSQLPPEFVAYDAHEISPAALRCSGQRLAAQMAR